MAEIGAVARLRQRIGTDLAHARAFSPNARLLLLALALIGVSYGAFSTLFTLYIVELGYDEGFLGLLVGVGSAAGALGALPAGMLSDRLGAHRGLLAGVALTAVGVLVECTLTAAWPLLAGAVVAALGVTLVYVAQAPFLAANSTERERTHLFSAAAAVLVAVSIVGSVVAGVLPDLLRALRPDLSLAAAYRATLLLSGAVSGSCLLALRRLRPPAAAPAPPGSREAVVACLASQAVRRLVLTGLLLALGGGLVVPFFNVYFRARGADAGLVGAIRAVGIVVTVLGSLAAPWLGGRVGLVRGVVLARLMSAPFLLLMGAAPLLPAAIAAFAARTFLVYLSDPLHTDLSMRLVPERARATANSLTFMSWNLTLALGGWAGGRIIAATGYAVPFALGSAITVLASGAYWLAFRSSSQDRGLGG